MFAPSKCVKACFAITLTFMLSMSAKAQNEGENFYLDNNDDGFGSKSYIASAKTIDENGNNNIVAFMCKEKALFMFYVTDQNHRNAVSTLKNGSRVVYIRVKIDDKPLKQLILISADMENSNFFDINKNDSPDTDIAQILDMAASCSDLIFSPGNMPAMHINIAKSHKSFSKIREECK